MKDRELLEAAAKAAGMSGTAVEYDDRLVFLEDGKPASIEWSPLTDDGDALRLAAALQIDTWHRPGHVGAGHPHKGIIQSHEAEDTDRATAARRAIVRAAASLPPNGGAR